MRRERGLLALVACLALAAIVLLVIRSHDGHDGLSVHQPFDCHQLDGQAGLGENLDSRTVTGAQAATWLRGSARERWASPDADRFAGHLSPTDHVTVCLMREHVLSSYSLVAVAGTDGTLVAARGGQTMPFRAMSALLAVSLPTETTTVEARYDCSRSTLRTVAQGSPVLPGHPVAARLCVEGTAYAVPRQSLTRGVRAIVRDLNRSTPTYMPPDDFCSPPGDLVSYSVVFRYPSGIRVVAANPPCNGGALVGPYPRAYRGSLTDVFLHDLRAQLGDLDVQPPPCPTGGMQPAGVGDLRQVVAARLCPPSGGPGTSLSPARVKELVGWVRRSPVNLPTPPTTHPCARTTRLALADVWGDRFSVVLACGRATPVVVALAHPVSDDHIGVVSLDWPWLHRVAHRAAR